MPDTAVREEFEQPPEPDVSHLVTEDDEPVDNPFSEKQQRLLVGCLDESWTAKMRGDRPFIAFANVGLFFAPHLPPVVPDVQVSLDVSLPENLWEKKFRSYMCWAYGKPPDLVLEIVSGREGRETEEKFQTYARQGVAYYAIFDPTGVYSGRPLRLYELHAREYVERLDGRWLPALGLGLTLWEGTFSGYQAQWVRWVDQDGEFLPLPSEAVEQARAETERARAEAESARSEAESARSEAERARSEAERARSETESARSETERALSKAESARQESLEARRRAEEAERALQEMKEKMRSLATTSSPDGGSIPYEDSTEKP